MNPSEGREPEAIDVRVLVQGEEALLARAAPGVFDRPVDVDRLREFLADRRHHLAVAIETGTEEPLVVGMATALDYLHPDKPAELWIDEVGVAPERRGRGIGRRLVEALFEVGRRCGCRQAWVLTEATNLAARSLFRSVGGVESAGAPVLLEFSLTAGAADRDA